MLLKSYIKGGEQQLYSAALQIAAHEARQGRGKLALEIRNLVNEAKSRQPKRETDPYSIFPVRSEKKLASLLSVRRPETKLTDMVLPPNAEAKLKQIVTEQRQRDRLQGYGLFPRRKILLVGSPGSGKSMTADALAGELQLPLFIFTGGSVNELPSIFSAIAETKGVYLFEVSNAIGTQDDSNAIEGIYRRLNSLLPFVDGDSSENLVLVAIDRPDLIARPLTRRFDDVVEYGSPSNETIQALLANRLVLFETNWDDWSEILSISQGLSLADLVRAADEAAKQAVLSNSDRVCKEDLIRALFCQKP
jgi:SpoVK/Ycf46/Vps4 family AAA+-type ATPase